MEKLSPYNSLVLPWSKQGCWGNIREMFPLLGVNGKGSDLWSFWILIGTIRNEFEKWMMVVSCSVKLC